MLKNNKMKVLFVLTSHSELGTQEKNRIWVEEFAAPYYELADKGVIDIATPLGGQPPIDPKVMIHQQQQKT
jgi:hypothetical protein